MPQENFEQLLERATSVFGIQPGYWDIFGNYRSTSGATKQAILSAMGVPAGSADELEAALRTREQREWERLVPPSLVVSESKPQELTVHVPADALAGTAVLTIRREDGSASTRNVELQSLPHCASAEIGGRLYVRKQVALTDPLPLGYHELSLQLGNERATTRYIVTPDRAWSHPHLEGGGRAAGITLSLYGIRSNRNWGCGDFRDLLGFADWAADELQVSFIGLNPLHAIHNRKPFNTSPYLPNCVFYQNFLYLDVEAIEDFARSRRAQQLRRRPDVCREIEDLRETPYVEYEKVAALKLRFLKLLFLEFLRGGEESPRKRAFQQFREREGDLLEKFATYCALDEYLHKKDPELWIWPNWPEEYRDPESAATRAFQKKHWRSVLFYQYLQWQIDLQWGRAQQHARERRLSIGLYHDFALATDRYGADLWGHRPFYITGCRVGSPPDDFSPTGQDWGFPPPHSEHHGENGYRLWAEAIRKNLRHAGALRLDHVMRLFRLFWIPDGLPANEGAYVRELSEDFLRVLALESVRNQVLLIGEDLGTVEPEVRQSLAKFGILSYRLFYFERNRQGAFKKHEEYPEQALVSSTTHDLPTLAGFWVGADIKARREAGILDDAGARSQFESRAADKQKVLDTLFAEGLMPNYLPRSADAYPELTAELHNAVIGFLAMTPSQLLAINQEDLTKELDQQNVPGTTWQCPNWQHKMRYTLEELRSDSHVVDFTAMLRHWIGKTGRDNRG